MYPAIAEAMARLRRTQFTLGRARSELVEDYPRALEEILQQVQDERGKKVYEFNYLFHELRRPNIFVMSCNTFTTIGPGVLLGNHSEQLYLAD